MNAEQLKLKREADTASVAMGEAHAQRLERLKGAPKLSSDTVVDYLDWISRCVGDMPAEHLTARLNAAELVVRIHMGNAQGKATAHTEGVEQP